MSCAVQPPQPLFFDLTVPGENDDDDYEDLTVEQHVPAVAASSAVKRVKEEKEEDEEVEVVRHVWGGGQPGASAITRVDILGHSTDDPEEVNEACNQDDCDQDLEEQLDRLAQAQVQAHEQQQEQAQDGVSVCSVASSVSSSVKKRRVGERL